MIMKLDRATLNRNEAMVVNTCIESYIKVYGEEKWNSLNAKEQHDVIMTMCSTMFKALN